VTLTGSISPEPAPGERAPRLGEMLVARGKIEPDELERALELPAASAANKIGKIMVDMWA